MSGLTFRDTLFIQHSSNDAYINYQTARQDMGSVADKQFNGWLAIDGSHIIMERNLTDNNDITTKYFHGGVDEAFATNWTNRAILTYGEYNALFT